MSSSIFLAPTANFVQKTLNGAVASGDTTITLSSTTNLQAPGVIIVDRVDTSGNLTSGNREVISYTGISSSNLTGCSRGVDNSSALAHADGAVVETAPTVGMWNNLATIVGTAIDNNGYLKAIASPVSIAQIQALNALVSNVTISNLLNVSGASVVGIGYFPVFRTIAAYSGPTIGLGGLITAPKTGTLSWISVLTRTVASAASVQFDFMVNGSSVFAGITAPTIVGGGTYVSTASINTKAIPAGSTLRADLKTLSASGVITDITIQGGTI